MCITDGESCCRVILKSRSFCCSISMHWYASDSTDNFPFPFLLSVTPFLSRSFWKYCCILKLSYWNNSIINFCKQLKPCISYLYCSLNTSGPSFYIHLLVVSHQKIKTSFWLKIEELLFVVLRSSEAHGLIIYCPISLFLTVAIRSWVITFFCLPETSNIRFLDDWSYTFLEGLRMLQKFAHLFFVSMVH